MCDECNGSAGAVELVGDRAEFKSRSLGFQSSFSSAILEEPLRSSLSQLKYSPNRTGSLVAPPTTTRRSSVGDEEAFLGAEILLLIKLHSCLGGSVLQPAVPIHLWPEEASLYYWTL